LFGEEIDVRLHYILADDTIEVLPNYVRNCGRDKVKLLLRRTKVTKVSILNPSFNGSAYFSLHLIINILGGQ
jgi:hypothetical protein